MVGYLENMRRRNADEHPYIGSVEARELRQMVSDPSFPAQASYRWPMRFRLAQLELQLGNEREAIKHYLWCRQQVPKIPDSPEARSAREQHVTFELGVAYMRLGETENCCLRNHPDSCIMPIQGGGIHTHTEGSQEAIKCFLRVLELGEPEDASHLSAKWLLNLAWMTLGEHPQSVPEKYLIPAETFESKESFARFTNIAQRLKLDTFSMCGGAIIDDFDNDNYLDLIVSSWDPNDQIRLFRNQQDGSFTDWTDSSGLKGFCGGLNMLQADYNNDGNVDVLVLRGGWLGNVGFRHPNSLLRNNGDGTFTDVTLDVGMVQHYPTQTAAWADYDNDGDLDLYIGNETEENVRAPCQLYRNDGDTFRDVADSAGVTNGGYSKAVVWGDFDGDRYPDLYVSNNDAKNRLYRNNRDGTFTDIATAAGVDGPNMSFPAWFWDYDNDGHLDLYVSAYTATTADIAAFHLGLDSEAERSCLYRGDGQGGFVNVASKCGLERPDASMGANFGDLDNDGYLDFYLGTGYPRYGSLMPSVMYLNRGGNHFVDVTTAGGFGHLQKGHAVAFADLDHDGDQDVFEQMGGAYPGDQFNDALYENPGLGNHWITLQVNGIESNRSAIGARICVEITEAGKARKIYRHINSGGSFGASPLRQTIGLGSASSIDRLEVYWPTTDTTQAFTQVAMDGHFSIVEGKNELVPIDLEPFQLGGSE